jgi:hydrogenase expression/formation protein HypC
MCLAIPGKITSISGDDPLMKTGQVSFGGILKEINLVYVPEAKVNDYVIAHVGFAISILNKKEAHRIFETLDQLAESESLEDPLP